MKYLPLLCQKFPLRMPRKGERTIRRTYVLAVVVADWKLRIALFFVRFVHNANITATKYRTLLWIICYRKLNQI